MAKRRLTLCFSDMQMVAADVRRLHESGYTKTGNWNLAQVLEHLNGTLRMTVSEPPPFLLPSFVRPFMRVVFMPVIKRGKPFRLRGKSPSSLLPGTEPNLEKMMDQFFALIDQLTDPQTEFVSLHPVFGNLNREQWLMTQCWHCAHHLSFLVPNEASNS